MKMLGVFLRLSAVLVLPACGTDGRTAAASSGGASSAGTSTTSPGGTQNTAGGNGGVASTQAGSANAGQAALGGESSAGAAGAPANGDGIASKYPGDQGIDKDPAVIFADDFESYTKPMDLLKKWDNFYQQSGTAFSTSGDSVFAGKQSLEFTVPQQDAELSNAVDKLINPELDALYLRYYARFQAPYDVVGSSHNGSSISAHYFNGNMATPGIPADGMNKFLVNLENWRGDAAAASPGDLNVYVDHPLQRDAYGDHFFPTGLVMPNTSLPFDFGPDFVKRPDIIPELDRWYCYEYSVKANTPGQKDGRITFWLDGVLAGDFPNLRLRDTPALTIDHVQLSFHIHNNPNGETKRWFDNVVAATSYIGPMQKP
jgi:hypothetical protein